MKQLLFLCLIYFSYLVVYGQADSLLTKPVIAVDNKIDSINQKTTDPIIIKPFVQPVTTKPTSNPATAQPKKP